ncbi:MAG: PDZ domain-containing protein, partial [Actinobacteria bacterium]|nr:PDZ domain-containing protein [Actinomycetota bacterium]
MSNLYNKVRHEIAAGGDPGGPAPKGGSSAWIALAAMAGLVAWAAASNPWTLVFVAGLLVCVFLHEMGHYLTARLTGMKVTQFFMGFGPRIWSRQRGELEYGVRALPLGAFVRIVGMNNLDDCPPEDEPRAYRSKSYSRRMLVITAGSLMHLVVAFLLFAGTYATSGRYGETGEVTVLQVVDEVLGTATGAKLAGLQPGDVLVSIDGVPLRTQDELIGAVGSRSPGDEVTIVARRGGTEFSRTVELVDAGGGRAFLGIGPSSVDQVDLGPLGAIRWAGEDLVGYAFESVKGVFVVLDPRNLVSNVVSEEAD